jgi:hypothetical protein
MINVNTSAPKWNSSFRCEEIDDEKSYNYFLSFSFLLQYREKWYGDKSSVFHPLIQTAHWQLIVVQLHSNRDTFSYFSVFACICTTKCVDYFTWCLCIQKNISFSLCHQQANRGSLSIASKADKNTNISCRLSILYNNSDSAHVYQLWNRHCCSLCSLW